MATPNDGMDEVKAELSLIRTEDGGRLSGITTGYRPPLYIGDLSSPCAITRLYETEWLEPGHSSVVDIIILWPESLGESYKPGAVFELREGPRVVATGKILEIARNGQG